MGKNNLGKRVSQLSSVNVLLWSELLQNITILLRI